MATTPNGAFAYVTNALSDTVSVIAVATKQVVATIPVGTRPQDIAITPNGASAYVTNDDEQHDLGDRSLHATR